MSAEKKEKKKIDSDSAFLMDLTDDMWKGFIQYWWIILVVLSILSSVFFFRARHDFVPQYTAV